MTPGVVTCRWCSTSLHRPQDRPGWADDTGSRWCDDSPNMLDGHTPTRGDRDAVEWCGVCRTSPCQNPPRRHRSLLGVAVVVVGVVVFWAAVFGLGRWAAQW